MITVETWPVSQFDQAQKSGTLIVSPEYQRRPVWATKDQMLLVDSVARGVPIGAITLYADDSKGYDIYEVIDGKQRLTSLLRFLSDGLIIKTSQIEKAALDDDEFDVAHDEVTANYHDRRHSELDVPFRMKLGQYQIPIFLVRGDRSTAIRSFARMNRSTYSLKPQEIRNAFFTGTHFLTAVIDCVEELDSTTFGDTGSASSSLLVRMGGVSGGSWDRMQDLQLVSELLVLILEGVQHRRDSLDGYYSLYREPKGEAAKKLGEGSKRLRQILLQLWHLAGETSLQAYHFPSSCEHDLYGLVGALHTRGLLTKPQMESLGPELMIVVSEFRSQVEKYVAKIRAGETPEPGEFEPLVEKYGRGFLGGQTNSKARRQERIDVWIEVVNGLIATLDSKSSFTETQRRLIWAESADKTCVRCGDPVKWEQYHAGHKVAWALGGRTVVENGRVEHANCNQSAGATGE